MLVMAVVKLFSLNRVARLDIQIVLIMNRTMLGIVKRLLMRVLKPSSLRIKDR